MARTKQTARKSTGGKAVKAPPPVDEDSDDPYLSEDEYMPEDYDNDNVQTEAVPKLFPPSPPPNKKGKGGGQKSKKKGASKATFNFNDDSDDDLYEALKGSQKQANLSEILSPSVLLQGKSKLKGAETVTKSQLDREGLLVKHESVYGSMSVSPSLTYIKSQSRSSNVAVLDFSGTEQISDLFMYMLMEQKLHLPLLERLSLSGCTNLTDAGVIWMTRVFTTMNQLDLNGCKHVTELSLFAIIDRFRQQLQQINMRGTNVGLIPLDYESSVTVAGCPLVSPAHKLYTAVSTKVSEKMNRPKTLHKSFKMVIFTEDTLPWSPLSVITADSDVKAKKLLRVRKGFSVAKDLTYNIFEVPIESGFSDVVMSEGCVVLIPYLLAEDGPDLDYADEIVRYIGKIFAKYPECLYVLMPMTEQEGLEEVAIRYKNLISRQFGMKTMQSFYDQLKMDKTDSFKYHTSQRMCAGGWWAYEQYNKNKEEFLLQTDVMTIKSDLSKKIKEMYMNMILNLQQRFPARFMQFQEELKNAISDMDKLQFPPTDLQSLCDNQVAKLHFMENFTTRSDTPLFLGKIMEFMRTMGKVLYYPELHGSLALSDFGNLELLYERLVTQEAPNKATWRFLGSNIQCWTRGDLAEIISDNATLTNVLDLLEAKGVLLKVYRDNWTTELKEPYAYVPYKKLPFYPKIDVEDYWPEGVPRDEYQMEQYFTFLPGIPDAFFPNIIRQCLQLGGINLLWNKGIIIQKGPVSILYELLSDLNNTPVLFVGARLMNGVEALNNDTPCLKALCCTLNIYTSIVTELLLRFGVFAKSFIPCPTCLPTKNRYKIVNSRESEVSRLSPMKLMFHARRQTSGPRHLICNNDGSNHDARSLLGEHVDLSKIMPSHYYLGCLPSFSAYNRCMFCRNCALDGPECSGNLKNGATSWNCSCDREGQMCDKCGMCQRCVSFLCRISGSVQPSFQEDPSMFSLNTSNAKVLPMELSPNYCPRLEVCFVRGANLVLTLKMGAMKIIYNTGNGIIGTYMNTDEKSQQTDDNWRCHDGNTVTVDLSFSPEDADDMVVVFSLQGRPMFEHRWSSQSCTVELQAIHPMSVIVTTPGAVKCEPQGLDSLGEKVSCSYTNFVPVEKAVSSSIEAVMLQGKQFIENALFQAGGVNYSGSSFIMLPEKMTFEMLQYPSYAHVKEKIAYHLLCYTRSKISDVLTFGGTQAVPESWAVYRMLHLVDNDGMPMLRSRQKGIEQNAGTLLWAWHFLLKLQPMIQLPKESSQLVTLQDGESAQVDQVSAGLYDLLELAYWRLLSSLDIIEILPIFNDLSILMAQAQTLQRLADSKQFGMRRVESKYNEANILHLCPGHHASMQVEEGITEVLPEIYGSYSHFLLSVDLPANEIQEIPADMFNALPNLAEFDASNNFIQVLPASIGNCKKLYSLTLCENNISDLPDTLSNCKDLFRLDISNNTMSRIPPVVTKLKSLKRLYGSNLFLTSLPEDIGNLVNLDKLYVNGNCLTSLPKSITNLRELTDLSMSGVAWFSANKKDKLVSKENYIKSLKQWGIERWLTVHEEQRKQLDGMIEEGYLDAVGVGKVNAILFRMFPRFGYQGQEPPEDEMASGFPMEILELTNLEYLSICYHGFVHVPQEIGRLQELKMLHVSHNPNLLTVPGEVGTISCLQRLEMDDCPLLKTPPKEIRAKGFATTFAYLARLMSGSMPCKRTKLMLVGLGGAGKTSLVKSLLSKDGKADLSHGEEITDGIDISSWTVRTGDESITYSVWDFAGQTVYYNTHQFFLSNRAVYLLLWNVRLGYEHAGLDFWLSSISVQAPKAPIFVVGSHCDKVSKYEVPINQMMARYKQVAGFHFISSYTGQGIGELKEHLFDVTLQQQYMGEQIPEVWLTFESNVISERASRNVIEFKALEKTASVSGIFEKTEVSQAVQFLHELGSLQHFTNEALKDKVVINPQWIVDVMACVVSVKNSPIKEGRLKHSDIATVWKDYPEDLHSWLLKLTEEYDLTFPLQGEPINLVPCLLPEAQPQFSLAELDKDSDIKENKMVYKFDYLPAGLFNRGQVRLHQISDSALIWKKGSYLKKNGHIALLQQNSESELVVTVQGPRPDNVLFLVHEVFEGLIAESFRGVTYDYLIPCPDCLKMVLKEPHMFTASTIRRALELKAPFLQCIKYFHTISCVDLLACMPPDNHSDFDLHLVQSVRSLRDLRKDLSADIFISYCPKDAPVDRSKVIHPATVCDDLCKLGYKCWFPQQGRTYPIEEMARALTDASVFVVFISSDYVKDEECVNVFKYARLTLRKPMVVVSVGNGFEWKQSKLGILLSDEVFVNMIKSKREVYQAKFDELVSTIKGRTNKQLGIDPTPSCFFSYTWVNSPTAVKLGTRAIPGAIGYGDPREIKQYLEDQNVKCWIDVERVGQNGLFDDIAEGLLSAKVVVVCVSDEYAASPTCCMEFRYAANELKLPIILAVVGTGHKWRLSEVGVLSLQYPIVNFQEKSDTCYSSLLSIVKDKMNQSEKESTKDRKNKANEDQKNLSFQELFELAQRKLLRQLSFYAEHHDVDVYPRLFVVDFSKAKSDKPEEKGQEETESGSGEGSKVDKPKQMLKRMASIDERGFSKKISELKAAFRLQRYCVHVLCEHDEGWHSVSDPLPLPHEFGESLLDKYAPFIARIAAVMKHNKHFNFDCLESEVGEDYLKWLEENPAASLSDYQQVYHDFRQMVIEADSHQAMGKLARCRLPNGKIIWLCESHRTKMKVTVLSTEDASVNRETVQPGAGNEMHMITGLRTTDFSTIPKFEPSASSTGMKVPSEVPKTPKTLEAPVESSPAKEVSKPDDVKTRPLSAGSMNQFDPNQFRVMAQSVELLPDKEAPQPAIITNMKAEKEKGSVSKHPGHLSRVMAQSVELLPDTVVPPPAILSNMKAGKGKGSSSKKSRLMSSGVMPQSVELLPDKPVPQPAIIANMKGAKRSNSSSQQQQQPTYTQLMLQFFEQGPSVELLPDKPMPEQQQQQQQQQQLLEVQQQQQQKRQLQQERKQSLETTPPELGAKSKTYYGQDQRQSVTGKPKQRPQSASKTGRSEKGSRTCIIM